jgi:hypothetical protein
MLKTLKQSEFNLLINKQELLIDYFNYIMENPDSILTKMLGVFKFQIGKEKPTYFVITENMIGEDKAKVIRNYDLKGSIRHRKVKITQ